jgi:hypothetical protein
VEAWVERPAKPTIFVSGHLMGFASLPLLRGSVRYRAFAHASRNPVAIASVATSLYNADNIRHPSSSGSEDQGG